MSYYIEMDKYIDRLYSHHYCNQVKVYGLIHLSYLILLARVQDLDSGDLTSIVSSATGILGALGQSLPCYMLQFPHL